jgi:hypothetical protein
MVWTLSAHAFVHVGMQTRPLSTMTETRVESVVEDFKKPKQQVVEKQIPRKAALPRKRVEICSGELNY